MVSPTDHAGAGPEQPEQLAVDYERAVAQASDLLLAHLKSCPDDAQLSRARHDDDTPTLYLSLIHI